MKITLSGVVAPTVQIGRPTEAVIGFHESVGASLSKFAQSVEGSS
jgi:hypothetical protein